MGNGNTARKGVQFIAATCTYRVLWAFEYAAVRRNDHIVFVTVYVDAEINLWEGTQVKPRKWKGTQQWEVIW